MFSPSHSSTTAATLDGSTLDTSEMMPPGSRSYARTTGSYCVKDRGRNQPLNIIRMSISATNAAGRWCSHSFRKLGNRNYQMNNGEELGSHTASIKTAGASVTYFLAPATE